MSLFRSRTAPPAPDTAAAVVADINRLENAALGARAMARQAFTHIDIMDRQAIANALMDIHNHLSHGLGVAPGAELDPQTSRRYITDVTR
jgi:hypothetical protein